MDFSAIWFYVRDLLSKQKKPQSSDSVLMQTEKLLMLREGVRNTVYKDSTGKLTVGIGHLVLPADDLILGDTITDAQVNHFFAIDINASMIAAEDQAAQAKITSEDFIPYLTSVNYQLGVNWTKTFPNTWSDIVAGEYETAAVALGTTLWFKQTPVRVQDFQKALRALPKKGSK